LSQVPLYDSLAVDYDRFVNWKERLAHELPFMDRLFEGQGVQRVLDTACGTGYHSIALAQKGYEVVGTDLSPMMIRGAYRNSIAAGEDVKFLVAGFGEMEAQGEKFDAVLCLGNSLPHLLTAEAVVSALADFAAVLRPGGFLLIQNRNFDQVWAEQKRFMMPQSHREPAGEWLFIRFYDFHKETITFNMIRLWRTGDDWEQEIDATELRPILRDDLAGALVAAGFGSAEFFGGYDASAFDPASSGDLIAVARKD
jgi:SAM-dependent methyltransferase